MGTLPALLIFVLSAAAVWAAGTVLAEATDILDERLHLGSATGGAALLAVATNLPEIAITVSATLSGSPQIAVANILGGVAIQTVVLVALDTAKRGSPPLTYRAADLSLVLEGLLVVAVLLFVTIGVGLDIGAAFGPFSPASILIGFTWFAGLLVIAKTKNRLPWQQGGRAADAAPPAHVPTRRARHLRQTTRKQWGTGSAAARFALAAGVTLGAGVALERSGETAANGLGLSGVIFGATVLAASTAIPELATGFQSIRLGDDQLAVSDIFGGNAFLPVLFLVSDGLAGHPVLPGADKIYVYLAAVGAILTLIYMCGLILRSSRRKLGVGIDSLIVLALYAAATAGLIFVT